MLLASAAIKPIITSKGLLLTKVLETAFQVNQVFPLSILIFICIYAIINILRFEVLEVWLVNAKQHNCKHYWPLLLLHSNDLFKCNLCRAFHCVAIDFINFDIAHMFSSAMLGFTVLTRWFRCARALLSFHMGLLYVISNVQFTCFVDLRIDVCCFKVELFLVDVSVMLHNLLFNL